MKVASQTTQISLDEESELDGGKSKRYAKKISIIGNVWVIIMPRKLHVQLC